ncbi:MAG: hypothetical protein E6K68_01990 [Nitrospirae bacterium]|nr:MAG: hypothetical protein E6K68_01990 [Nitrospirota bacterium]
MTPEEQIAKMTKAIHQAIKVLGDRFGSTPGDDQRTIQMLKDSLPVNPAPAPKTPPAPPPPSEQKEA